MGKLPPDLSIIIRARSEHFLNTFINDPQKQLPGTAMPRVGLTKESQEKVIEYLEEMGDPSKHDRQALGPWVLLYLVIFALVAFWWKKSTWKDH
jgi:ubiquinol-cytochrome c reductase cytochrome c1 subunit